MKAFVCAALLACATAAPASPYAPAPAYGYNAGQTSHQSVTKADGETRTLHQSKAFGASHATVAQADNHKGLHEVAPAKGGPYNGGSVAHHTAPIRAYAPAPAYHAAPVVKVAPAYHAAPVHHAAPAYHAAPIVKVAPAYHAAPVHHAAPAYHAKAEVYDESPEPYTFEYGVADDYSKASFNAAESQDASGNVAGSYRVNLPDGRIQTVTYTADGYNGFVADVSYEGTPVYPAEKEYAPKAAYAPKPVYAPAPAYHA